MSPGNGRLDRLDAAHAERPENVSRSDLEAFLIGALAATVTDEQWDQALEAARQTSQAVALPRVPR